MTAWTPERIATLRRLHGEGASASFIAERLGGITRNAVLGKVMRLGLSEPAPKDRPAPLPKPKAKAKPPRLCVVQGMGEAAVRRAARVDRPDVRVALVPSTGNVTSGATTYTCVSLPREPWVTA